MFIPIGDEPNPRQRAIVNYALIAANVLVFLFVSLPLMSQPVDFNDPGLRPYLHYLATRMPGVPLRQLLASTSAYDVYTFEHGFRPAHPEFGSLFYSLFLHGGWLHLIGNMLFLWIFGDNVENRLGRLGYLLTYLGTGVAATLFFSLFQMDSSAPLIGASGAISGVLGAYFWWFPQNRVRVLVVLFFFIDIWRVPARIVLGVFLLLDNLLPFLAGGSGGVAYGAHIGGFLAGLGVAMLLGRNGRRRLRRQRREEPEAWVLDRNGQPITRLEPTESFRSAVRSGRFAEAAELYAHMSPADRAAESDADVLALAHGLSDRGRAEAALAVLQSLIGNRPTSPVLAEAHYLCAAIHLGHTGRVLAARQHLLSVLDLDPSPPLRAAAREGLVAVDAALRRRRELDPR
jgi:membrane associated rhomboid family serine protease